MTYGTRLFAISLGVGGLLIVSVPSMAQEPATTSLPGKRWAELETLRFNPKMSPDTVADYRPAVASRVSRIPQADMETLPALVQLMRRLNRTAAKSPGRWVSGFAYLGANPREYRPSDAELVAGEVGDRIHGFVSKASLGQVVATLKRARVDLAPISYSSFQFRHADVMGTGRYFYASAPRLVTIAFQVLDTTATSAAADTRP